MNLSRPGWERVGGEHAASGAWGEEDADGNGKVPKMTHLLAGKKEQQRHTRAMLFPFRQFQGTHKLIKRVVLPGASVVAHEHEVTKWWLSESTTIRVGGQYSSHTPPLAEDRQDMPGERRLQDTVAQRQAVPAPATLQEDREPR